MTIIAVHGGLDTSREPPFMKALHEAAMDGLAALPRGRAAACEAALRVLEDSPLFNCGYGSVLNFDGEVEMDAAIADGATGRFAAVAAVRAVANPISLARALMEQTTQVILAGDGAVRFARRLGMPEAGLITPAQEAAWRQARERLARGEEPDQNLYTGLSEGDTVGCVVWDGAHLAAASSTGGCSLKMPGRVGDTPCFGAGIYASAACAVVCTGVGEAFIETLTARYVDELITAGAHPQAAVERALARWPPRGGPRAGSWPWTPGGVSERPSTPAASRSWSWKTASPGPVSCPGKSPVPGVDLNSSALTPKTSPSGTIIHPWTGAPGPC